MPRPDGVLYQFEKAAIKREEKAKLPPVRMGRPPKPKPPVVPPPPRVFVNQADALTKAAYELGANRVPVARNGRRPLKASTELIKAIAASVEKGLPIDRSCILHGIHRSMLDKWKKANAGILHVLEEAEIKGESRLVDIIAAAAPDDWKAANWLLERRHQWEQRTRTELTGKDGANLTVSQQLFATIAGAKDAVNKPRAVIDVTPRVAIKA